MTADELYAALLARRPELEALAAGRDADPLALASGLVHGTDRAVTRAAVRHVLERADPALCDLASAPQDARENHLAFLVALAAHTEVQTLPPPWRDAFDEVRYDLLARPQAYRDLSAYALALIEVAGLAQASPGGSIATLAGRAALDAPSQELLATTRAVAERARHAARLARWRAWLDGAGRALHDALVGAVDAVLGGAAPLAASDGPPDALGRARIGEALGGEVTLAVTGAGVLLEWDGDGAAPTAAYAGDAPLEAATDASVAAASWRLVVPPGGSVRLVGAAGEARLDVTAPG